MRQDARRAPYGSALDLPSVQELLAQTRGLKLLTRLIARDQRQTLREIEAQVRDLALVIDSVYALLGVRQWIFHDSLNVEEVKALVGRTVDEAEAELIELYQDPDTLAFMIRGVSRFEAMRTRTQLLERAEADYHAGRFYATTLVLLTVMDGFVNDLQPELRRGLHARDAEELNAWDSVVGHHLGLTAVHKTFTKSTSKTSNQPLFELQRNGIIHGTRVNYDNRIVATKAWNYLFAVGDWATSREKQSVEPEPPPRWRDLFTQIAANERAKQALDAWRPSQLDAGEAEFWQAEPCHRARAYLDAWVARNYGAMAALISPAMAEETLSKTAGLMRETYALHELRAFHLKRASFEAAAACEIDIELTFEGNPQPGRMRWIRETADGSPATPDAEAEWFLYLWSPWTILNR